MAKEVQEAAGIPEMMSKAEEFDFVEGFFKACNYKEEIQQTIEIRRNGTLLFAFRIHPISEKDMKKATEAATIRMRNPQGAKYPPIVKERDVSVYNSNIIYLATVDEDRARFWDNKELKKRVGAELGYEMVDKALMAGEKDAVMTEINKLCGFDVSLDADTDTDDEDFAKN